MRFCWDGAVGFALRWPLGIRMLALLKFEGWVGIIGLMG